MISSGEAASLRREYARVGLTHRYTRTPVTAGAEDSEGNASRVLGTPATNLPCRYVPVGQAFRSSDQLRSDERGRVLTSIPVLVVEYDSTLAIGDRVSNITDAAGNVLAAGPFAVETVAVTASFGYPISRRAELQSSEVRL